MTVVNTLFPVNADTFSIAVTSTASTPVAFPYVAGTIRLVNTGSYVCYVAVTMNNALATVPGTTPQITCTPVLAGEDVAFGLPQNAMQTISAICSSGLTTTLVVSTGEGM